MISPALTTVLTRLSAYRSGICSATSRQSSIFFELYTDYAEHIALNDPKEQLYIQNPSNFLRFVYINPTFIEWLKMRINCTSKVTYTVRCKMHIDHRFDVLSIRSQWICFSFYIAAFAVYIIGPVTRDGSRNETTTDRNHLIS